MVGQSGLKCILQKYVAGNHKNASLIDAVRVCIFSTQVAI